MNHGGGASLQKYFASEKLAVMIALPARLSTT
jgi:hypothetical protein